YIFFDGLISSLLGKIEGIFTRPTLLLTRCVSPDVVDFDCGMCHEPGVWQWRNMAEGARGDVAQYFSWPRWFCIQCSCSGTWYPMGATLWRCARRAGDYRCPNDLQAPARATWGSAYKVHHDATLLADAGHKVEQFLEDCAQWCAETGVACQTRQDTG